MLSDYQMAIAFAIGADFMMLGRYFARVDESPSRLVSVNGQVLKECGGQGSRRARNFHRYEHRACDDLVFEEASTAMCRMPDRSTRASR